MLSARNTVSTITDVNYVTLIDNMPPGALITLQDVAWDEYECILRQFDERPGVRLAYDHGRLQIMTLSPEHEGIANLFPYLIFVLAEESGIDFLSRGSMTMRKKDKLRGLEPDDCFYFRNFKRISGKKRLDLRKGPPPELAIEVDVTSGSMSKFAVFASLGVPELWRHDSEKVRFYRLIDDEHYSEIRRSDLFPFLTPGVLTKYLRKGESGGSVAMGKAFRTWVRTHKR
jgi:Uma2 family endonuclease